MPSFSNTSSEEIVDKRYRNFMLLLYPDWRDYENILQDIKGNFKRYAYIKHIPEEAEKKEHVHLILSLDNPRTIESLSKRVGIPKNLIQSIKGLRGSCRYLVHMDNEEKFQYNLDQVIVSNAFKDTFFKSFDDLFSEEEMLDNIFSFIEDNKHLDRIILEVELVKFVNANGFSTIFKRYYNSICKYINYVSDNEVNII